MNEHLTRIYPSILKNIKFITYDLDGTLNNTMSGHKVLFGHRMKELFGLSVKSAGDHYFQTAGLPTAEQISSLLEKFGVVISPILNIPRLADLIDAQLENVEGEPFEEVPLVLSTLKDRGYKQSVSSSHKTESVERILKRTGLSQYIEIFVGTDSKDPTFKKGRRHFEFIADTMGVPYHQMLRCGIFIGDGTSDMEAAKSSGMIGIGRIGTKNVSELVQAGALFALPDLSLLPQLLS